MLPPDWIAGQVANRAGNVAVHLTCKDMNRNGLEAAAWRYASQGFWNILALTGDHPTPTGFKAMARPVFDFDSISLITLLQSMNEGLVVPGRGGSPETLPKTQFNVGCAVSPFKLLERELVPQYLKLLRKIQAGARWVIPQLGYDMRKFHEIKLFLDSRGVKIPVIGNVYRLTKGIAKVFHSGKLAGCVVTDALLADCDKYAAGPDKGKKFFTELAAKQVAVFKGLGFAAAYLGGFAKADMFAEIVETAERFGENDWRDFIREIQYAQPGEFFLFEHDPSTGLSDPTRINPTYTESLTHPPRSRFVTPLYRLSRVVHSVAFEREKGLWNVLKAIYKRMDTKSGVLGRLAYWFEHRSKVSFYDCQDCGDCSLPDCTYICPISRCTKGLRNGPCGGSCGGLCEMGDRECFWAMVYERLKHYQETERLAGGPVVFYNPELRHTSSWANTYLDRDHSAPKQESKS
jgi:methylenetetrahydrofolate reductase (NADPH)